METRVGARGDLGHAGGERLAAELDAGEGADVAEGGEPRELEHVVATAAEEDQAGLVEDRARAEVDRVAEANLHRGAGRDGEEDADARRAREQRAHALGDRRHAEDVPDHGRVVEARRGRPLGDAHLGVDAGADEVVDQRRARAPPRPRSSGPGLAMRGGIGVRFEPQEERAHLDLALDVVGLGEGVVVERERRVARRDLADVVAEGRRRVAVLDEVAAGARERVATGEPRHLGDAVEAVAALGGEGERHLPRAELGLDHLDREGAQDVGERALARVEREERDQAIDGGKEDEPLGAERDALGVEAEPGGAEPGLVDGDAVEHAATGTQS